MKEYSPEERVLLDACIDAADDLCGAWEDLPGWQMMDAPDRYQWIVTAHNKYAACVQRLTAYYAQRKAA